MSTQLAEPVRKPSLKERMKGLYDEYGKIAIAIYFAIFFLVIAGFAVAIQMGFKVEGADESSGLGLAATLGAAWVAAKVTQPLRILATLVLTPVVGKLIRKTPPAPPSVSG